MSVPETLARLIGADAISKGGGGRILVAPASEDACATVLQKAHVEGWTVGFIGSGSWSHEDAPAEVTITTRRMDQILDLKPDDLFVTAQAGVPMSKLGAALRTTNTWIPIDEPGTQRTVGSVVSTATTGALQAGFGPVRDHVLGMTVVLANGDRIAVGGRVVKNVAGFDIPKLMIGGFGAFGLITTLHLRVRVLPERDITVMGNAPRDRVLAARGKVLESLAISGLDVRSPKAHDRDWSMAVRATGTTDSVERALAFLRRVTDLEWRRLTDAEIVEHREETAVQQMKASATLKIGPQSENLSEVLGIVESNLENGFVMLTSRPAALRWSGEATVEQIANTRERLTPLGVPVTVERAPWSVLSSVGHFGGLRPGVLPIVQSLQNRLDPGRNLTTPLVRQGRDGI